MLERESIPYIALDLDPDRVRQAAAAGDSVVFGDAVRLPALMAAGLSRASAVVITYLEVPGAMKVLSHTRTHAPQVPVIVRTQDDHDLVALRQAGATEVVPEAFEGSIMLASHALALIGVPLNRVVRRIRDIRNQRYALMRGFFHGVTDAPDGPDAHQARLRSVTLSVGAHAIGRTIGELGLEELGVGVSAVRRRSIRGLSPGPETRLVESDVVVLVGVPADLERAEGRMLKG
jgi:CPA2 family monovalent cation:H+ antiporter-2